MYSQISRKNAEKLVDIVKQITPALLNADCVTYTNSWTAVHGLGTAKLDGSRISTRMGTREDGAASWPVRLSWGVVKVDVAFGSEPTGTQIIEGLLKVRKPKSQSFCCLDPDRTLGISTGN